MKTLFSLLILCTIIACSSNTNENKANAENGLSKNLDAATLEAQIKRMQEYFKNNADKPINRAKGNEFITVSNQFVAGYPDHANAANYQFMAAEVARSVGRYQEAIVMLENIYTKYPDHDKAAPSFFLQAFTYEENIKDKALAKKYYNEFLIKYPDHSLTTQVQQLLEVIDQTPEELIERFKKQNQ